MNPNDEWITSDIAAAILGVDPRHVDYLCRQHTLTCKKARRDWLILRSSVETYAVDPRRRPKHKPS